MGSRLLPCCGKHEDPEYARVDEAIIRTANINEERVLVSIGGSHVVIMEFRSDPIAN